MLLNGILQETARHWRLLTASLISIVTVFSLIPLPELPPLVGGDKTHHLIAYGSVAFPVSLARPRHYWLVLLGIIVWSGAIEIIQPMVNRYGEWLDLFANGVGVVVGLALAEIVRRYYLLID